MVTSPQGFQSQDLQEEHKQARNEKFLKYILLQSEELECPFESHSQRS